jgi:hypothetical protein
MRKIKFLSVFVSLALLLSAWPGVALAQGPLPKEPLLPVVEGKTELQMGQKSVIRVADCDPSDPSSTCFLVREAIRGSSGAKPGGVTIQSFTVTDHCAQSGYNIFGQKLWTHRQRNNVTFSGGGLVKLNWADLAGTSTFYPGWRVDSTSGPHWNPSPGTWTSNLDVWSSAQFSLVILEITWQTVTSGITYHNNGSSGTCSYY